MRKRKLLGKNFGIALACLVIISVLWGLPGAINAEPAENSPISFGETLSGSIDMAAEADSYTFSAGADDTVLIRMTKTSGDLIAEIRLYDPDGNLLDEDWSSTTAEISHTLPTSGTYTIFACDDIGNRTGEYNIYLQRLSVGPEGSISGVVEDDEGNPIEGASVGAYASADFGQSAETGSEGQYTIYGLPSGWYWVEVEAEGFVGEWYDDAYDWPDAQPVEVIAPNDTPNINFTLELGGSISGHVYEADENTPIEGAGVDAHDYDTNEYICHVTTDENGFYVINGLATGKYRLSASAKGHAKEMYGGGRDWWAAPPVEVTAPHETTGINFALEPGGTVSGTVYDSEMHPLPDMAVKAIPVDGGPSVGDACTDEDGHYTMAGVPYGEYKVKAWPGWCGGDPRYQPEYWEEKSNWENADIVTVSEGVNPAGIDFTLEIATGSISGVVHYTGSISNSHQLWIIARRGQHGGRYRRIDCTGPGDYAYTIRYVPDGTYIVAGILDSHDTGLEELVTDEPLAFYPGPVTVSGGGETSGIDITLADPTGSISGEISYSGEMDSHSIIVTASAQPYTDAPKIPAYFASLEEPGDYSFPTIADGTYYLNAWLDLNGNWEADLDEPSGEYPDKVVISGGSSATDIDINIGPKTIYVDDDFTDDPENHKWDTIQEGIDDASSGDTINVAAGKYKENIEIPDDKINLFLIGADRETTVISAPGDTGPVVIIMADSVNFEGFTVQGGTTGSQGEPGYGIGIIGASYCVIDDNITTANEIGIGVIGGTVLVEGEPVVLVSDNNLISRNESYGNSGIEMAYGIMLMNCSGTRLKGNEIHDNGLAGIGIMGGKWDMDGDGEWDHLGECLDNRILGNKIYGHTRNDMGAGGVLIWNASNNTISGNDEIYGNITGVAIFGWTSEEYGFEGEAYENCISDNNIYGNTNCGIGIFGVDENCYGNSIMGNTIEDSGDGIWIGGGIDTEILRNDILNNIGEVPPMSGIHVFGGVIDGFVFHSPGTEIHHNNIEGNLDYGVYNEDTEIVDASNNWWGNASGPSGVGPGTGDAVSDNVDYEPWLTEEWGPPWLYDEDDSGYIEIDELLHAISDYIGGDMTISQLLDIISLYIGHTPKP